MLKNNQCPNDFYISLILKISKTSSNLANSTNITSKN